MEENKELTQQEYEKKMKELYKEEFEKLGEFIVTDKELQLQIDDINVKIKKLEYDRQEVIAEKRKIEQIIKDIRASFKRHRMSYTCINPKTTEQ